VSYEHASDFTLYSAVASVRTDDLQQAVSQVSAAYAAQGVAVTTDGDRIVVRSAAEGAANLPGAAAAP
jgi:hypothetical protein